MCQAEFFRHISVINGHDLAILVCKILNAQDIAQKKEKKSCTCNQAHDNQPIDFFSWGWGVVISESKLITLQLTTVFKMHSKNLFISLTKSI